MKKIIVSEWERAFPAIEDSEPDLVPFLPQAMTALLRLARAAHAQNEAICAGDRDPVLDELRRALAAFDFKTESPK